MTATTTKKQFVVTMSATQAGYDVHAAGCRHLRKMALHLMFGKATSTSGDALKDGLVRRFADNGWTADMIRVMNCCANAPAVDAP